MQENQERVYERSGCSHTYNSLTLKLPACDHQQARPTVLAVDREHSRQPLRPVEGCLAEQGPQPAPSDFAAYVPAPFAAWPVYAGTASAWIALGMRADLADAAAFEPVYAKAAFVARVVELFVFAADTRLMGLCSA